MGPTRRGAERRTNDDDIEDGISETLSIDDEDGPSRPLLLSAERNNDAGAPASVENDDDVVVRRVLAYTFVSTASRSIWNANVLATLVYLMRDGDPEAVGALTGIMGTCNVAASIPAAAAADRYRRDVVLGAGSVVLATAIVTTLFALRSGDYATLTVAFGLWGVATGTTEPAINALLADRASASHARGASVTAAFTNRSLAMKLGSVTGPCVALIGFAVMGNSWTIQDCSLVVAFGQMLSVPTVYLLRSMSDDDRNDNDDNDDDDDPEYEFLRGEEGRESTRTGPSRNERESSDGSLFCMCVPPARRVPFLLASSDFLFGVASGMSIRYFAVFLYDDLGLSPVPVQVIYVLNPLLQAVLTKVAQRLALARGNCRVVVALKSVGVSLLFVMVAGARVGAPAPVTCVLLVLRTAAMNSTRALTRAMLLDSVPKRERARWSVVESLTSFSWSGSAFVGGWLVRRKGILFNFCVTGVLQIVATSPLTRLFGDEDEERRRRQEETEDEAQPNDAGDETIDDDDDGVVSTESDHCELIKNDHVATSK